MSELLLYAGVALLLASLCGPLGCLVVWRRMAYFGDALAHTGLLGVGFGIAFSIHPPFSTIITTGIFALGMLWLTKQPGISHDTALGILAHTALASGVLILLVLDHPLDELHSHLFGGDEALNLTNLFSLLALNGVAFVILRTCWTGMVLSSLHPTLARAENIPVDRMQLYMIVLIAALVAIAMHIVGLLMVTSLLIIPAAASAFFAKNPVAMAIYAALIGLAALLAGFFIAHKTGWPAGPTVVLGCVAYYFTAYGFHAVKKDG